jgi:hypothetical protein
LDDTVYVLEVVRLGDEEKMKGEGREGTGKGKKKRVSQRRRETGQ